MSITLKKDQWKVKDPSTGTYRGSAIFSTTLPEDAAQIVEDATDALDAQQIRAQEIVNDAQNAVDGIDGLRETMIASIASVAGQGTDSTLTQQGVAADAAACGDLKNTITNNYNADLEFIKSVNGALIENTYDRMLGYFLAEKNFSNVWVVYVPVGTGYIESQKSVKVYCPYISDGSVTLYAYASDKSTIINYGTATFSNGVATFSMVLFDTAKWVRFVVGNSAGFVYLFDPSNEGITPKLSEIESVNTEQALQISENYEASHLNTYTPISLGTISSGYIKSDGTIAETSSPYFASGSIDVSPGEKYRIQGTQVGSAAYLWCMYENGTKKYISDPGTGAYPIVYVDYTLTIPSGVNQLRIGWYNTISDASMKKVNVQRVSDAMQTTKKEISVLFVGNSLTQDGIAYLPYLLSNYYSDINFKFYMWYNGGKTLAEQYQYFIDDTVCEIFSVAENTGKWTNYTSSKKMSDILDTYTFDVVCMQDYFNYQDAYSSDSDLDAFRNCRDYIADNYMGGNGLEFILLFHAPKRDVAATVFSKIESSYAMLLQKTNADDMIANGIAIYRAMATTLDSLGDQGHLSNDGTHAQEGLPCLLQTFTTACWIFDKLGVAKSVYGCPLRITTDIYNTINVPGANLGTGVITGTDAQNLLAQEVAIKAYKEGKKFVIDNLFSAD